MRHLRAGVHLSRTSAHRKALFSNLVAALFTHDRIRTTDAKAKATRRIAERTITWARRLGDVLGKPAERRTPDESARVVHAVRMARRIVRDRDAIGRLFEEIAPRFLERRGGYTRIVKLGQRPGDAAPMAMLELIPGEGAAVESSDDEGKGKGVKDKGGGKTVPKASSKAPAKSEAKSEARSEGKSDKKAGAKGKAAEGKSKKK